MEMKTKLIKILGFYYPVISYASGIIAMLLSLLAILSPNGIIFYENNMIIKISEAIILSYAILYFLQKIIEAYRLRESKS